MRIGAIAVGVLGGIITAGSIAAVVAWLVIRRRRTHPVPSPIKEEKTGEMEEQPTEPYHFGTPQRIYVSQYSPFFLSASSSVEAYESESD
jgi:hypothetical protein